MLAQDTIIHCSSTRLKTYEESLEIHLKKLLTEMEDQANELKQIYKQKNSHLDDVESEERRLHKQVSWMKKKVIDVKLQANNAILENPTLIAAKRADLEKSLEQSHIQLKMLLKQEKELQRQLDLLNANVSSAIAELETAVWTEKNDVSLLKTVAGKTLGSVLVLEKQKRLQDAYIDRLKKDIQLAEEEMFKLGATAKVVKNQHQDRNLRYLNLTNRLKNFATGSLTPLEDHWQRLLKNLRSKENNVKLLVEGSEGSEHTDRNQTSSPLFKSRELALQYAHLEEAYTQLKNSQKKQQNIMAEQQRKNQVITQLLNRRSREDLPQYKKLKDEQEMIKENNKKIADKLAKELNERRMEIGLDIVEGQRLQQLAALEEIEKETFYTDKKIEIYKELLTEMQQAHLIPAKTEEKEDNKEKQTSSLRQEIPQSPTSANLSTYSKLRQQLIHLTRRKLALEHKKQRLKLRVEESQQGLKEATEKTEILSRELGNVEKETIGQLDVTFLRQSEGDEATSSNLENRIEESTIRQQKVKLEIDGLRKQLDELRKKCDDWRSKTGPFESLRSAAEQQVECAIEIHSLKKAHQKMEHRLWKTQKELEFTVMHRDYAVNKAHIVLGTHNEARLQRAQKNKESQDIGEFEVTRKSATRGPLFRIGNLQKMLNFEQAQPGA